MGIQANKEQEEVIRTINGPLLVVAGPGSGKTTTMIRRIRNMIDTGIPESSILMVTFTRDAAIAMREKYKSMYGAVSGCTFQTLHAMCLHLLKQEGRYHDGCLLDAKEQADHVLEFVTKEGIDGDAWDLTQRLISEFSVVKNGYSDIENYEAKSCDTEFFRCAFKDYEDWKDRTDRFDFDDLMIRCLEMLKEDPGIRKKWQEHYRYIQCDEYQDTNCLQRDILYYLTGSGNNLCVVGDDDQSIYGFRGARPEVMLEFTEHFKDAKTVRLTTNYRSCQSIVDIAGDLIKYNTGRFDKEFVSFRGKSGEDGKAEYIRKNTKQEEMEDIMRHIREKHREGARYEDMAILVRTNRQIMLPVSALSKNDIPFFTTERVKSIYSHWIFKDIKAYADLSAGRGTEQDIRLVLNHPNRHLDAAKFHADEFSYRAFRRAIGYLSNAEFWKYEAANTKIREWMNALGPGKITNSSAPSEFFTAFDGVRHSVHYSTYLAEYAKFRKEDVSEYTEIYEELKNDAMKYETMGDWLSYASYCVKKVDSDINKTKKDKAGVRIATMHGSKGLEWKYVFIMDCNEKVVPHKNSLGSPADIAEERRLLYVAITRAKDEVYIYNSSSEESRFMKQIKDGMAVNGMKRIPKYLPGKGVFHKRFGKGKLLGYEEGKIHVLFDSGKETKLMFPESFLNGFMRYED